MIRQLLIAWCLMASSVLIHAYGVHSLRSHTLRRTELPPGRPRPWIWLFIRLAGWTIVLHLTDTR